MKKQEVERKMKIIKKAISELRQNPKLMKKVEKVLIK